MTRCAAIGVQHVAIERDRHLPHGRPVHHGAQRAADETLDLLGAAGLLATGGLALAPFMRGARKHAVFGRDPAQPLIAQERRHPALDARDTQNFGRAHADERRPLGVAGEAGRDRDRAQQIRGAAGWSH
jgi:hypothetical protein